MVSWCSFSLPICLPRCWLAVLLPVSVPVLACLHAPLTACCLVFVTDNRQNHEGKTRRRSGNDENEGRCLVILVSPRICSYFCAERGFAFSSPLFRQCFSSHHSFPALSDPAPFIVIRSAKPAGQPEYIDIPPYNTVLVSVGFELLYWHAK